MALDSGSKMSPPPTPREMLLGVSAVKVAAAEPARYRSVAVAGELTPVFNEPSSHAQ